MRRISHIPGCAPPVGPFSQAVVANGFVFTSGQLPTATDDGPDGFEGKVRQVLINLDATLREAGSSLGSVVKVNTYLTDREQLGTYNKVYSEFFSADLPARTTICVDIFGIDLEIDCIATVEGT